MLKLHGAVLEFLRDRFKGALSPEEHEFVVAAAQIEVAPGDSERVTITFVNLGATTIYIAPSLAVGAGRGMRLGPTGGMISMNVEEDSLLPALNWFAFGSGPAGVLYTLSVRRNRLLDAEEE